VSKRKPPELPLDSPHWRPLIDVYRLVCTDAGSADFAIVDLQRAVDDGVRGKVRNKQGERLFDWSKYKLMRWKEDRVAVCSRADGTFDENARFWVWGPDFKKICPTAFAPTPHAAAQSADDKQPTKGKPGPKTKHNWKLTAAAEMAHFVEERGRPPSAPELAQLVDVKLKYYPDESEVRKLIRFLLSE
jgi:hypothetical protein